MAETARFPSEDIAQRAMEVALSDILLFRTWVWLIVNLEQNGQTRSLFMAINPPPNQEEADLAFERLEKAGFSEPGLEEINMADTDQDVLAFAADYILEDK